MLYEDRIMFLGLFFYVESNGVHDISRKIGEPYDYCAQTLDIQLQKLTKSTTMYIIYNFNHKEYYCIFKRIIVINNIYGDYYTSLIDDIAILERV